MPLNLDQATETTAHDYRQVVRVRTCTYATRRGLSVRRDVSVQRRLSGRLACLLDEEVTGLGPLLAANLILNLHTVEDGLYQLVTCNETYDRETGCLDSYDLKLIPYESH